MSSLARSLLLVCLVLAAARLRAQDMQVRLSVPQYSASGLKQDIVVEAVGSNAAGYTLIYDLPLGTMFQQAFPSSTLTCTTPLAGNGGAITCHGTTGGTLRLAILIPGGPYAVLAPGTVITHSAVVSAPGDPDSSNNKATAASTVKTLPDFDIVTTMPPSVAAGAAFHYTVTLHNRSAESVKLQFHMNSTTPQVSLLTSVAQTSGPAIVDVNLGLSQPSSTYIGSLTPLIFPAGGTATLDVGAVTMPGAYGSAAGHSISLQFSDYALPAYPIIGTLPFGTNVVQSADVTVSGSAPPSVFVNETFNYTIDVTDLGPSASGTVTTTWTAPPNASLVFIESATNALCTPTAAGVVCSSQVSPRNVYGESAPSHIVLRLRATATGTIANSVTVAAASDTNPANNTSSSTTTSSANTADLAASVAPSTSQVKLGADVTWAVTLRNNGPAAARDATLAITLPEGSALVSTSCGSAVGNAVTCAAGTIAAGTTATVRVVTTMNSAGTATLRASATSSSSDPFSANNAASAAVTVLPSANADVAVSIAASKSSAAAGDVVRFTATAVNDGPDALQNYALIVTGTGASRRPLGIPPCAALDAGYDCRIATLAAHSSQSVTFDLFVPAANGPYRVSVHGTAANGNGVDLNAANDDAAVTVTVTDPAPSDPSADLGVTLTGPAAVEASAATTQHIVVRNAGPKPAGETTLLYEAPENMTIAGIVAPAAFTCRNFSTAFVCTAPSFGVASMAVDGTLAVGPAASPQVVTGAARVSSAMHDPNGSDNDATVAINVSPAPPYSFRADPPLITGVAGQPIAFSLRFINNGTAAFADVVIHDAIPAGLTLVSATPSSGTCSAAAGALDCRLGNVGAGQTATVDIVVIAAAPGRWTSSASAQSGSAQASADVVITAVAPRRRTSGH